MSFLSQCVEIDIHFARWRPLLIPLLTVSEPSFILFDKMWAEKWPGRLSQSCAWDVRLYLESHCIQRLQTKVPSLWSSRFSVLWWLFLLKAGQMIREQTSGFCCWLIKPQLGNSQEMRTSSKVWLSWTVTKIPKQRDQSHFRLFSLSPQVCSGHSRKQLVHERPVAYLPTPRRYLTYLRAANWSQIPTLRPWNWSLSMEISFQFQ